MKRNTYCLCSNVHESLLPKAQNQLIVNLEPPSKTLLNLFVFHTNIEAGFRTSLSNVKG